VLQWNFGQGSLQPLLKRMFTEHVERSRSIFQDRFTLVTSKLHGGKSDLMSFARSIQHPTKHFLYEPWRGMFKSLGRSDEFQRIEVASANALYRAARQLCVDYSLWSERGVALMFDILVQNGSISSVVKGNILADFQAISPGLEDEKSEVARLRIIANRRADAAKARWREDVRERKLCIANGEGKVHGITFNLAEQFGIALRRFAV